jgi:hypothetical protein
MIKRHTLAASLILLCLGILGRLLPHLWNATPVGAIALFATAYLGYGRSILITFGILALSDIFLGSYSWPVMVSVYGSFVLISYLGNLAKKSMARSVFASLLSSTVFFLITNFAVWKYTSMYDAELGGLLNSYIAGLPFYKNMVVGDIFYTTMLFGAYKYLTYLFSKNISFTKSVFDNRLRGL